MRLSVYATPEGVNDKEIKDQVVVVIDVFRATSTMITALYNGCREIIPFVGIEEAVNSSRNYDKDAFLLCGEQNIQAIDGFHLSNSPGDYTRELVEGKTLLMTTTNGTRAVRRMMEAREVLICGLVNVDAIADHVSQKGEDVIFICAGTDGKFSLDDIITAGAVISRIKNKNEAVVLSDLALVCCHMYESYKEDLTTVLANSAHYQRLFSAGLERDIQYCLSINLAPVVGVYKDGVIKNIEKIVKSE